MLPNFDRAYIKGIISKIMKIHGLFKKYPTFGWEKYIYAPEGLQP